MAGSPVSRIFFRMRTLPSSDMSDPSSLSPPTASAAGRTSTIPAERRQSRISSWVKAGLFAPQFDAPSELITTGSAPVASTAASAARIIPGNELEAPIATASPRPTPASPSILATQPAKLGFADVRLASICPSDVVIGESSIPMRPVRLGRSKDRRRRRVRRRRA